MCLRCAEHHQSCVYSRSGIIRRRARRTVRTATNDVSGEVEQWHPRSDDDAQTRTESAGHPQISGDIPTVRESLVKLGQEETAPLDALDSLDAEYASFWTGENDSEGTRARRRGFVAFTGDEAEYLTEGRQTRAMNVTQDH